jgi:hypothetical protein
VYDNIRDRNEIWPLSNGVFAPEGQRRGLDCDFAGIAGVFAPEGQRRGLDCDFDGNRRRICPGGAAAWSGLRFRRQSPAYLPRRGSGV